MDADDNCRMDAEQVALVTTAGFILLGGEGLRIQLDQSGAAKTRASQQYEQLMFNPAAFSPQDFY